jgi:hypothetical protein
VPSWVRHARRHMEPVLYSGVVAFGVMLCYLYVSPDADVGVVAEVTPGKVALHSASRVSLSSTARCALKALTTRPVVMCA